MGKFNSDLFKHIPKPIIKTTTVDEQVRKYDLTVDLTEISSNIIDTKAVFIKGDRDSSCINANVILNKLPFNLDGYIVSVNIKENNYLVETFICEVTNGQNGNVVIKLPNQYVDVSGNNTFELVLQKGEVVITSQQYKYTVLDSLGEGDIGTEVEETALQSLIVTVQGQQNKLDGFTADLEIVETDIDDIINMIG